MAFLTDLSPNSNKPEQKDLTVDSGKSYSDLSFNFAVSRTSAQDPVDILRKIGEKIIGKYEEATKGKEAIIKEKISISGIADGTEWSLVRILDDRVERWVLIPTTVVKSIKSNEKVNRDLIRPLSDEQIKLLAIPKNVTAGWNKKTDRPYVVVGQVASVSLKK